MSQLSRHRPARRRSTATGVIYFHAGGARSADPAWIEALGGLGRPLFSRRGGPGWEALDVGPADLSALCAAVAKRAPGQPLLVIRAPLALDASSLRWLEGLLDEGRAPAPRVIAPLSNTSSELNPFAGLDSSVRPDPDPTRQAALVRLLGRPRLHRWGAWPEHFAALNASAVSLLAEAPAEPAEAVERLRRLGDGVLLAEQLYCHDPDQPLFAEPRLEPHEIRPPAPWGGLGERLGAWLRSAEAPEDLEVRRPLNLHVLHSWGGGVATWVDSFVRAAGDESHLQLLSEETEPGRGAGQRLSLYLGRNRSCPIDSWWLQPTIDAVDDRHEPYRQILDEIQQRFGVDRVIVSSLIGHSLDALRTDRPTVQVLHDHFPAWPLLSVHPAEYGGDLAAALGDPRALEHFSRRGATEWRALGESYLAAASRVALAAPSRSVIEIQHGLGPGWERQPIELIPHGLPPLPGVGATASRPRPDGRLRLVIPGRMLTLKGADILEAALERLVPLAQIYLLGVGRGNERFFGRRGVNVLVDYRREDLAALLRDIGPHAAALLSIVPETFSYTLSEMKALGVPVIATRLGAFRERIEHGVDGWLIEPTAQALVDQVTALAAAPGDLDSARAALAKQAPAEPADMIEAYRALCPARKPSVRDPGEPATAPIVSDLAEIQLGAYRDLVRRAGGQLEAARALEERLQKTIRQRTAWGLDEKQRRRDVERRRDEWIGRLQTEIAELREQLRRSLEHLEKRERTLRQRARHIERQDAELERARSLLMTQERELATRAAHIEALDRQVAEFETERHRMAMEFESERSGLRQQLDELGQRHADLRQVQEQLEQQYDAILNSRSWRLTRPLRAGRRVGVALAQTRAWNPLRWPLLSSALVRNLSTRGVRGTVERLQRFQAPAPAPAPTRIEPPAVEMPETAEAATPEHAVELPESVPRAGQPRISVVIPAYNHLDHTALCLASIARSRCETPFEVLVVDDASGDASAQRLPLVEGLYYHRNEENRGFIHTCNHGADHARGEFLVFLNNDTQVEDGWLDRLLEVFESRPDAGVVGARLVYPDGRLQECGGLVFRDGSGWNYGRGDDPDRPEYQYLRETDYVSGACLAIRSELFAQLGGFDDHYAPAYYEDTDLAFRVRAAGLKVYVQPAATVVHHEGVSSGTDIEAGIKRYQVVNREKFLARWQDALAHQPEPIQDPDDAAAVRAARDHRLRGRILVIDAYTPEPDQDSGSVRLTRFMECLRDMGYGVTFLADNRAWAGRYTRELQARGVEAWYDPWLGSAEALLERQGPDYAAVLISRHYIAINHMNAVRRYAPRARFLFDTVDLHYLREQRLAELEHSATLRQVARQTRRSELKVIDEADATLVVSPVEQAVLAKDAPDARVFILSNIHRVRGPGPGYAGRSDLYFIGGFQHPPNIDAVQWFCEDIWPRVRERLPDARFHVVGSKAPEEIRELGRRLQPEGVVFHGFVEDLTPFLDGCRLSVAPLRYGAGVKGKVNQAMSHGQPVVATSVAVEGLHAEPGRDVLLADDAEGFADAVVRLYEDPELWRRLSEGGLDNVRRHFSTDAARGAIEELFAALEMG